MIEPERRVHFTLGVAVSVDRNLGQTTRRYSFEDDNGDVVRRKFSLAGVRTGVSVSPIIPGGRRPWQTDPGHIHDVPEPPSRDAMLSSSALRVGFPVREYSKPLWTPGDSWT